MNARNRRIGHIAAHKSVRNIRKLTDTSDAARAACALNRNCGMIMRTTSISISWSRFGSRIARNHYNQAKLNIGWVCLGFFSPRLMMCGNGNFDLILLFKWCVLAWRSNATRTLEAPWMNVKCLWILCTIGWRRCSNVTRNHFIMATTNRTDFYPLPSNANRTENNGDGKTIGKAI